MSPCVGEASQDLRLQNVFITELAPFLSLLYSLT